MSPSILCSLASLRTLKTNGTVLMVSQHLKLFLNLFAIHESENSPYGAMDLNVLYCSCGCSHLTVLRCSMLLCLAVKVCFINTFTPSQVEHDFTSLDATLLMNPLALDRHRSFYWSATTSIKGIESASSQRLTSWLPTI